MRMWYKKRQCWELCSDASQTAQMAQIIFLDARYSAQMAHITFWKRIVCCANCKDNPCAFKFYSTLIDDGPIFLWNANFAAQITQIIFRIRELCVFCTMSGSFLRIAQEESTESVPQSARLCYLSVHNNASKHPVPLQASSWNTNLRNLCRGTCAWKKKSSIPQNLLWPQ